jgi:hypothetical protein
LIKRAEQYMSQIPEIIGYNFLSTNHRLQFATYLILG